MSGRVPPSSRAGTRPRVKSERDRAASRYSRFTGENAELSGKVRVPPWPTVVTAIGTLDFVGYSTMRDGRLQRFRHDFHPSDAPLLCFTPDGKRIIILAGNFTFTERGIVDKHGEE